MVSATLIVLIIAIIYSIGLHFVINPYVVRRYSPPEATKAESVVLIKNTVRTLKDSAVAFVQEEIRALQARVEVFIRERLRELVALFNQLDMFVRGLPDEFRRVKSDLIVELAKIKADIMADVKSRVDALSGVVQSVKASIITEIQSIPVVINTGFNGLKTYIQTQVTSIIDTALAPLRTNIGNMITTLNTIRDFTVNFGPMIDARISAIVEAKLKPVNETINKIDKSMTSVTATLNRVFPQPAAVAATASSAVSAPTATVGSAVSNVASTIGGWF